MPRSGTGTYTLPSGNPVVTGTTIESTWANTTLSDIATTLSDSLSRSGQGGMTAALRIADGTQGAPGVGFANETGSGFYRAGTGEVWAVVQGAQTLNLDASGVTVPSDKATSIEGTFVFNETGADKDARFEGDTDANLLFVDASTDRVGVGTNAPATKMTVRGATQNKEVALRWERATDGAVAGGLGYFYDSENSLAVGSVTNHPFKIITNDSTVATFDTSGNLGLGQTPAVRKFEINAIPAAVSQLNGIRLQASGVATSASELLLGTDGTGVPYTSLRTGNDGNGYMTFFTGSGPAERMRLDSSGNLGLGVTPSAWGGGFKALEMSNGSVSINANGPYINQNAIYDTSWKYKANGFAAQYQQIAGQHQWSTAPSGTAGAAISFTQAMTLDASGRLGIGQTSPQTALGFANAATISWGTTNYPYISGDQPNNTLVFGTQATERARITSGGNLLVGKTSEFAQIFRLVVEANSNTSAVPAVFADPRTDAVSAMTVAFYRNGTKVGSIDTTNAATSYVTSSDRRLKENIAPAADAGAVIDAIEVVQHDWKIGGHTRYGVIAQDLNAVAPEAVSEGDNGDEIEKTWGVDYSKLVPMLIKEIQSLRARVAALEAA